MNAAAAVRTRVEAEVTRVLNSRSARKSLGNAGYSVAEYIAQPIAMILASPFLVYRLGLSQYGVWMLVTAVVGAMGTLSGGFGDATVKYVSTYRGRNDHPGIIRTIRGTIGINAVLGGLLAVAVVVVSPYAVRHLFKIESSLHAASIAAFRVGGAILLIRSIESVFISTLRAYERYAPTVKLNILTRSSTIVAAVALAWFGYGVATIMIATFCISVVGLFSQAVAVRHVVGKMLFLPLFDREALSELAGFGVYSWLQALAGVVFSYADRLLVGALLGMSAVTYYTICVQAAQPIHGLVSAALNFLFPHMSAKHEGGRAHESKRAFTIGVMVNVAMVACLCLPLALLSKPILTLWMGRAFAQEAWPVLTLMAVSYGLLALNISGHYTMMALGGVRVVSILNVIGGASSIILAAMLATPFGITGAAVGRLIYGPITWLAYLSVGTMLRKPHTTATLGELDKQIMPRLGNISCGQGTES